VALVDGVTTAAVGAIAGACVVLGRRTLMSSGGGPDLFPFGILAATLVVLIRFKKLPEPIVVLAAAGFGWLASHP
jgi:chromate transporter